MKRIGELLIFSILDVSCFFLGDDRVVDWAVDRILALAQWLRSHGAQSEGDQLEIDIRRAMGEWI